MTRSCALLALLAITALVGATSIAHAQLYERLNSQGILVFSATPRGKGWSRVTFPGRTNRAYRRAPRSTIALEARLPQFQQHVVEAASLYQLPVALVHAVMRVESSFDPNVVSVDGAMGLMQLMPFTASKMGVADAFDPRQNILGGTRFLRILANKWQGNLVLTIASYNAGPGAVARYRGVPPYPETIRYVRRVLHFYGAYRDSQRALTGPARTNNTALAFQEGAR